jgi:hypothetical protein
LYSALTGKDKKEGRKLNFDKTLGTQNNGRNARTTYSPTSAKSIVRSFAFAGRRKSLNRNSVPKTIIDPPIHTDFREDFVAERLSCLLGCAVSIFPILPTMLALY